MDTEIRDAIARSLPDLAMIVRRDGVILSCVGGHAVRGFDPGDGEIPGRNINEIWPEAMAAHMLQTVRRILKTRKPAQQRYQDGDTKYEMRFQVQGFDRALVVCRDLGAGAQSNDSGLYEKSGGPMLPHRDAFEKSLRMALDMAALREDTVGVALIHIGGYITYQRVFDSALANRLVEEAAKVVLENLGEGRTNLPRLARVSDDVIGVVLTDIRSRADADNAINAIVKALRHPVDLDGQVFQLAPQAGVTLSGVDGTRASELIDRALTTLDAGRHQGSDRLITFYSDTLRLASLTRLDWQEELAQAIRRDELELHYQPRLTLATREIVAVEAFLRWPHKIRGLVPTSEFLPIAELSGLSVQLGRWVLRRACRDLATLAQRGYPALRVSVNVGRQYLSAESLAEDVASSAREAGIEPSHLDLEITEQMLSTGRSGLAALHQLRGQGVRVLIDDFGTGYVSLGRLRNSPLDGIMIDRSFVEEVGHDHEARAVCRAAIALGHAFGLRIVAEGIETDAQAQFLVTEQCHEGQGHLFAPATPLSQLIENILPGSKTAPASVTKLARG
ncbi:MAG TPA: GGDEF domain-containing phosphodiesterase [Steroidobacteraceae bacterium]|jgi:EAL domain-containing protein (putative c-di-GMP-specific phosphodiesterase class I)/GGDEF domain-containing protein|nr:GGDEF domain-containing phosphodiesterase [Steroidobacteraceae bacterium]